MLTTVIFGSIREKGRNLKEITKEITAQLINHPVLFWS
jgi:hypothetical protein